MALFKRTRQANAAGTAGVATDAAEAAAEATETPDGAAEEAKLIAIAEYVRTQTKNEQLVAREQLATANTEVEESELAELIEKLKVGESYLDIESIPGKDTTYFYSSQFMSASFARIKGRLRDQDMQALIAGSVREESQVYPRPALQSQFLEEPFFLNKEQLDQVITEMGKNPEYSDVKVCITSDGTAYLYSDRHLTERHALSIVDTQDLFDMH